MSKFHVKITEYQKCRVVLVDIGYVNFTYMDGRVSIPYILDNNTLTWLMEYLLNYTKFVFEYGEIYEIFDRAGINVSLAYVGIAAERLVISYEQEYMVSNNSLTPVNRTYVKPVNPYYKFYVLFNDIRYAYPIKVGLEDWNGSSVLKFIEMFIPPIYYPRRLETVTLISPSNGCSVTITTSEWIMSSEWINELINKYVFRVDDHYLEEIVQAYRNAIGNSTVSLNDLTIADIYYMPTDDYDMVTPIISLYRNSSGLHEVVVMRLYKNGPIVISVDIVAGTPSSSDPLGINVYIDQLVRYAEEKKRYNTLMSLSILLASICLVTIVLIIIGIHRMKHEKK